ncbi:MFS transporter [Runella limosa]|uniref:MFS transporter n=1 Tax=Runella limosa TaxID=370978 RepID=UPI000425B0B6|nr:MFS transporter [Runella limosa]
MKNPKKVSKEIIVFTSCSMVLTALGIDIMLPAFAEVRHHFAVGNDVAQTDKLVTFFFMGQIMQIVFGYLTDKIGRLPILRFGILLYTLSGFATVFSPSLPWMFFFRFISGMGAAAVFMTSIASVRDRYAGDEMARVMSLVLTLFLFTPVIAPSLGAVVLNYYSWQWVFLVPPIFAVLVFIWSFRMDESLPVEARNDMKIVELIPKLKSIATDAHFLRYVTIATLIFSVLSSYVSSSERIIGDIYQRPDLFPVIFGAIGLLMAILSLTNSYFTKRYGAKKTLRIILVLYLAAASVLLGGVLFLGNPPPMVYFFVMIALLMAFTTAGDPNSGALALEFMGENAGLAAAVDGTIFFFIGSGIGAVISSQLTNGVLPLAIGAVVASLISVILAFGDTAKK